MTDLEKLKELQEKIEPLKKEVTEVQDTIYKTELAKSRYKYWDYGYAKYWVKIKSVNEENCTVLQIWESPEPPFIQFSDTEEPFSWLITGTDITEDVFNKKREEIINKLKV